MRRPVNNRILYVGTLPPHTGGSAISCSELVTRIARAGYAVTAIAPITAETLRGGDRFAASRPELRVVRYTLPHFDNEPGPGGSMIDAEAEQITELFPEVADSLRPGLVIVGRESFARCVPELSETRGIPVMQWLRGGPYAGYDYWKHTEQGQHLVREFRRADRILTAAEHLTSDLLRLGFANVRTIPNAIDLDKFTPRPVSKALQRRLEIRDGDKPVLVPGTLIARKRPFDILASAAKALERDPKLVYVMAGTGVRRAEVEAACRDQGLSERFRFPGWVDYAMMPDLYNLADFVLVASESEGLARVYLEAMACGKLLLASEINASRELITDNVNGLLFRVGDIEGLARKTTVAASDSQLRARVGGNARQSVQSRSLNVAASRYVDEIAALLSRDQCSSPR